MLVWALKIKLMLVLTVFLLLIGIGIAQTPGSLIVNVSYADGTPVWNASVSIYDDSDKTVLVCSGYTEQNGIFVNNTPLECDHTYWVETKMSEGMIYFGPDYFDETCTANADVNPMKGDITGEINGSCSVNILDLIKIGNAFGSTPGKSNWNPLADIKKDNIINIFDLSIVGKNYGKDNELSTFYQDKDGDGYGNQSVNVTACVVQPGYVIPDGDCDDNNVTIHSSVTVYVEGGLAPYLVWIEEEYSGETVFGPTLTDGSGITTCLGAGNYLAHAQDYNGDPAVESFTEPGTPSVTMEFPP